MATSDKGSRNTLKLNNQATGIHQNSTVSECIIPKILRRKEDMVFCFINIIQDIMRKYLFIFGKYKIKLILLAAMIIAGSVLQIVITYYGGIYLDIISKTDSLNEIYLVCGFIVIFSVLHLIIKYVITYIMSPLIEKIIFNFEYYFLGRLKKISIIEYKKFNIAYLAKRIEEDSRQVVQFFIENYINAFIKCVEIITILTIVIKINWILGLVMVLLCPIYIIVYTKFMKPIYEKSLTAREKSAEYFQGFVNQLEYMENIVIDSEYDKENKNISNKNNVYLKYFGQFISINNKFTITQGLIVVIMQITIYTIGGINVFRGNTSVGQLSILLTYFLQILSNVTYYNDLAKSYQTTKASISRLDSLNNLPVISEGEEHLESVFSIKAKIDFYIEDHKILENIEVEANKGEVIGIIGKNGTGKTTLLKLLIGAIKLNEKDDKSFIIYNNKYDIRSLNSIDLRKHFLAYVPQKIRYYDYTMKDLFNETMLIKTGYDLIKILDRKDIKCTSEIKDFIVKYWNEQIRNMSGGDQQLIEILRNIIKEKEIIFFDEPTSNLDIGRVEWFHCLVESLKRNMIVFVITHDNQFNTSFDKVIYLNK